MNRTKIETVRALMDPFFHEKSETEKAIVWICEALLEGPDSVEPPKKKKKKKVKIYVSCGSGENGSGFGQ